MEITEEKQVKDFAARPKIKTKDIALAAVLTGLSILFPYFLPTIPMGLTTVTPFSHLAIFIACFINPIVAVFTCIGAFLAFFFKGAPVDVQLRAASHIIFALFCSLAMYKKKGYKGVSFYAVGGIITVLHAAAEALAVVFAVTVLGAQWRIGFTLGNVLIYVGLITIAHSIFDYTFAVLIYNTLSQARLVSGRFDLRLNRPVKTKSNYEN